MKRVNQLNEQGSIDLDSFLHNDKPGWSTSLKLKVRTLYNYIMAAIGTQLGNIISTLGGDVNGIYVAPVSATTVTAAHFAAAALDENLNNADLLLDRQVSLLWGAIGGGSAMTVRNLYLSGSQLWSLNSIPLDLIPAPGADKAINVYGVLLWIKPTAGYNAGSDVTLKYSSGKLVTTFPLAKWNIASEKVYRYLPVNDTEIGINESIHLTSATNDASGTANNEVNIVIAYSVINLLTKLAVPSGGVPPLP